MIDLLLTHLKAITIRKKMIANVKCTASLFFFFSFSVRSFLFFNPKISMQKDEVNAVKAPSALGKRAEINPIIKITEITFGIKYKATVGNKSSPFAVTLFICA